MDGINELMNEKKEVKKKPKLQHTGTW